MKGIHIQQEKNENTSAAVIRQTAARRLQNPNQIARRSLFPRSKRERQNSIFGKKRQRRTKDIAEMGPQSHSTTTPRIYERVKMKRKRGAPHSVAAHKDHRISNDHRRHRAMTDIMASSQSSPSFTHCITSLDGGTGTGFDGFGPCGPAADGARLDRCDGGKLSVRPLSTGIMLRSLKLPNLGWAKHF